MLTRRARNSCSLFDWAPDKTKQRNQIAVNSYMQMVVSAWENGFEHFGWWKDYGAKVAGSTGHRHVPQHDSDQSLCTRSMMHHLHATRGRQAMQSQLRLYAQKISCNCRGYSRLTKLKFRITIGESDNLLRKREVEIKVLWNERKGMRPLGAYNRQHRRLRIPRLKWQEESRPREPCLSNASFAQHWTQKTRKHIAGEPACF